jgi:hypothetical protein
MAALSSLPVSPPCRQSTVTLFGVNRRAPATLAGSRTKTGQLRFRNYATGERGENSVPAVFQSESQASAFIRARIAKGCGARRRAGSMGQLA